MLNLDQLESELNRNTEMFDTQVSELNGIDKSEIETFLHSGISGGAKYVIERVFSRIGNEQLKSTLFRLYIITDIYITAKMFMESIGIPKEVFIEEIGSSESVIQQYKTQDAIKSYIIELLEKCVKIRCLHNDTSKISISQAKNYIAKHYHEPDISLGRVAATVNICVPHFCHLFKKEVGETFVSYLTNIRMKKAKELLCCSSKRIAQIAYEVGYNDYHYFTSLFKKQNGITPCEFRRLNGRK